MTAETFTPAEWEFWAETARIRSEIAEHNQRYINNLLEEAISQPPVFGRGEREEIFASIEAMERQNLRDAEMEPLMELMQRDYDTYMTSGASDRLLELMRDAE